MASVTLPYSRKQVNYGSSQWHQDYCGDLCNILDEILVLCNFVIKCV